MIAPPASTKCWAFSAWWSPVANGYGTRIAGLPAAAISQTVEPERESTRSQAEMRRAETLRLGEHPVVVAPHPFPHELEVAPARQMQDRRPGCAPRLDDELVQRLCARERAEHAEHAPVPGQLEDLTCFLLGHSARALGDRAADDAGLRAVPGRDRVREEDALGERCGEPVREAEVRVGLRQRCRYAERRGREDHRAGDEAAAAEHDVRAAARAGCGGTRAAPSLRAAASAPARSTAAAGIR